jgi:hypothetical protein
MYDGVPTRDIALPAAKNGMHDVRSIEYSWDSWASLGSKV